MPTTKKYPNCQQTTYTHSTYHSELARHQLDLYDDGPHEAGSPRKSGAKSFREVLKGQVNKPSRF